MQVQKSYLGPIDLAGVSNHLYWGGLAVASAALVRCLKKRRRLHPRLASQFLPIGDPFWRVFGVTFGCTCHQGCVHKGMGLAACLVASSIHDHHTRTLVHRLLSIACRYKVKTMMHMFEHRAGLIVLLIP
jgi:hypothetical protein